MNRIIILLGFIAFHVTSFAQQKANYELAERMREITQAPISKNTLLIRPTFIKGSDCFYYSFQTEEGKKYYWVDPKRKEKRLLFDNAELVSKVSEMTRKPYNHRNFDIEVKFLDEETFKFYLDRQDYTYNIRTKELKLWKAKKQFTSDPYWMYYSADSAYMLFAKRHNLYLVGNPAKGRDTTEVQLTFDGEKNYSLNREDEGELDGRFLCEAKWFKRGNKFYALREDSRKVNDMWVVDVLAEPRPKLETYKYEMAGDKHVIQYSLIIGDADTRQVREIDINRWPDQYVDVVYSSNDGKRLYLQRYKRTWDEADICMVNVETGEVKSLIHEKNKPYLDYQMRSITFLNDGNEILFRSERSGWGHYYLYDKDGNLKNQVTSGAWVASPLLQVDTVRRQIYFYAYGRKEGVDPYYYILYRADLDKENALTCLTPENATHNITLSPSCDYYVDGYSRVDMEPKIVLKNNQGKVIMELAKPDTRRLKELGWRAPERFTVKAADGLTDIYGIMWKPADFDPNKKYPIISSVYPGPFFEYVNTSFRVDDSYNMRLAQLGFIVVSMGHRGGSPMRGKFYHRYGYGKLRDYPLADDKYAIEQLADRYAYIDLSKVGIFGHSGGGFMSTAALCTYPDFYTAAVSSAGNHDNNIFNRGWSEIYHGVKEAVKTVKGKDGQDSTVYTYSCKVPTNMELAKRLKGHLLLVTGDMDKNVHPANTLRMVDALIKAKKNFEMIVLPGNGHGFGGKADAFFERKLWYHFAKYLLGDESTMEDVELQIEN